MKSGYYWWTKPSSQSIVFIHDQNDCEGEQSATMIGSSENYLLSTIVAEGTLQLVNAPMEETVGFEKSIGFEEAVRLHNEAESHFYQLINQLGELVVT